MLLADGKQVRSSQWLIPLLPLPRRTLLAREGGEVGQVIGRGGLGILAGRRLAGHHDTQRAWREAGGGLLEQAHLEPEGRARGWAAKGGDATRTRRDGGGDGAREREARSMAGGAARATSCDARGARDTQNIEMRSKKQQIIIINDAQ